jgi:hypothetical protein
VKLAKEQEVHGYRWPQLTPPPWAGWSLTRLPVIPAETSRDGLSDSKTIARRPFWALISP